MWPKFLSNKKNYDYEVAALKLPTELEQECGAFHRARQSLSERLAAAVSITVQYFFIAAIIFFVYKATVGIHKSYQRANERTKSEDLNSENAKYAEMFEEFITSYQRSYNKEQKAYRFAIFIQNVKEFNDEEKRNPGLDLDVTQFADWTEEEMKNLLSNGYGDHHSLEISRFKDTVIREGDKRPMEINWRMLGKVTEVKNQMQCGSCWAFATVAAVESQYAIRRNQLITLSEQEMLDCDSKNNGCHGGYRPYAMKFVQRSGLVKDAEYPYNGKEGNTCKLSNMTQQRVYINDYQILSSNENLIADWIATNGPVTFGMNVTKAMYSYRNGIFTPSPEDCQNNSLGSHALTIVGYGTEEQRDFWLVKNSWGGRWGQEGYFKLARGVNSCGVANIVVAPVIN